MIRRWKRSGLAATAAFLGGLSLLLAGCAQAGAPAIPADDVPFRADDPADFVRDFITVSQHELSAIERGDRPAAARYRALIEEKCLHPELYEKMRSQAQVSDARVREGLARLTASWQATIAYYAAGANVDELAVRQVLGDQDAVITVPAVGDGDRATLRFLLHQAKDGRWYLLSVGFADRIAPTSSPAGP